MFGFPVSVRFVMAVSGLVCWPGLLLCSDTALGDDSSFPSPVVDWCAQKVIDELGKELISLRILSVTRDEVPPRDLRMRVSPTRLLPTDENGTKNVPLSSLRISEEEIIIQGWVQVLPPVRGELETLRHRAEQLAGNRRVRIDVVAPTSFFVRLGYHGEKLTHPEAEGRYGERPAAIHVNVKVPSDRSKRMLDVGLDATVTSRASPSAPRTRQAKASNREEAEKLLRQLRGTGADASSAPAKDEEEELFRARIVVRAAASLDARN